ncbi:MAG: hypothetical protein OHK0046_41490 [Anaerolineae bacterium]
MSEIHDRPLVWDADVEPITQFLLETYTRYGRLFNWDPRRWQGTVYHNNDADMTQRAHQLPQSVHLWLNDDQHIVGVVIPESPGSVFLQIHPDYRAIEARMLDWVETSLPRQQDSDGREHMDIWAEQGDTHRETHLAQRDYMQTEMFETMYRRPMSEPLPTLTLPEGYRMRTMRQHPDDQEAIARLLNAAFNRTFHSAEEYRNFQRSPYYRAEFDMVVEAADGTLAANAGLNIFEHESFALVEPVCTHPNHQGKGLARAAIVEGLRRAQEMGIKAAFVGAWYSNAVSNHVYQSLGFTDGRRQYLWRRYSSAMEMR